MHVGSASQFIVICLFLVEEYVRSLDGCGDLVERLANLSSGPQEEVYINFLLKVVVVVVGIIDSYNSYCSP